MTTAKELMRDLPSKMAQQAELQELRWVASELIRTHDAKVGVCECPLCRHARPYVETANEKAQRTRRVELRPSNNADSAGSG